MAQATLVHIDGCLLRSASTDKKVLVEWAITALSEGCLCTVECGNVLVAFEEANASAQRVAIIGPGAGGRAKSASTVVRPSKVAR